MGISQVKVRPITGQEMRDTAVEAQVVVPVEQTWVWAEFEETFPDRDLIGFFEITADGEPVAVLGLTAYDYHGFKFVWCKNGPVWLVPEDAALEKKAVRALVRWIKRRQPSTAFLRMHLRFPLADAKPPMQITPYDRTVIVDLADTEDDLMAGYKRRMRTQIRGARRKTPVELADESLAGAEDFGPYYKIMEETAERQDFTIWPQEVYEHLLRSLGEEYSRLYVARVDGEVAALAIFTMAGRRAAYYYAAANEAGRDNRAPVQLLHYALLELGKEGNTSADLMGVGSELAPSLNPMTALKSGFAAEITTISPAYDVPVNKLRYKALELLRDAKTTVTSLTDVSALKDKLPWRRKDETPEE